MSKNKSSVIFTLNTCVNNHRLTCMVSSPWRSCSRLTMVCSLWDRTLVFLSLVLSSRPFRRGLMRATSMGGIVGSLNTHHNTRSDTSLMSLDWFWRHCVVTETRRRHDTKPDEVAPRHSTTKTLNLNMHTWLLGVLFCGTEWIWHWQQLLWTWYLNERMELGRISWLDPTVKLRTLRGSDTLLYLLIYS